MIKRRPSTKRFKATGYTAGTRHRLVCCRTRLINALLMILQRRLGIAPEKGDHHGREAWQPLRRAINFRSRPPAGVPVEEGRIQKAEIW